MAGKTLNEDLSTRYVHEFFHGALFEHEGVIHKVRQVTERDIVTHKIIAMGNNRYSWDTGSLSTSVLKDFTSFKYPTLGYRQLQSQKYGPIVVYINTRRSAQRGLREDGINFEQLPVYHYLTPNPEHPLYYDESSAPARINEIFYPTFTPWSKGLPKLLAGEIAGFAISEQLAVGLSVSTAAGRLFEIYFRGRVAGHVDENGQATLINKILMRENIHQKLFI